MVSFNSNARVKRLKFIDDWNAIAFCRGLLFAKAQANMLILEWPLWDWSREEEVEVLQLLKTVAEMGKSVIISSTNAPQSPLIHHTITIENGIKTVDESFNYIDKHKGINVN